MGPAEGKSPAGGAPVRRALWAGALLMLLLALFGITGIIRLIAGDAAGMRDGMLRWAPPEATGFPEEAYGGVAEMLTGYLTGSRDRFEYTLIREGKEIPCFRDYEAAHMADCRGLIRLDTGVCVLCGAGAVAAGLVCAGLSRDRRARRALVRGGWRGLLSLGLPAALLLIWAWADFDGLFVTFHRVAFRNDLWLLDPRTDLLIRLMPGELFVSLGERGLALGAAWITLLCGGLLLMGRGSGKQTEENRIS